MYADVMKRQRANSDLPDREKKTYKLKRSINEQENTPSLAHLIYIDLP